MAAEKSRERACHPSGRTCLCMLSKFHPPRPREKKLKEDKAQVKWLAPASPSLVSRDWDPWSSVTELSLHTLVLVRDPASKERWTCSFSRGLEFHFQHPNQVSRYMPSFLFPGWKPLASAGTCTHVHKSTRRHTHLPIIKNSENKS